MTLLPNDPVFIPFIAAMIREARYLALFFAGHMMWNVSTGGGDHRFTGDPDPSSPDYYVLAQPVVLTLMQQYVANGTLLSDDLILLTPSVTATVTTVVISQVRWLWRTILSRVRSAIQWPRSTCVGRFGAPEST